MSAACAHVKPNRMIAFMRIGVFLLHPPPLLPVVMVVAVLL